MNTMTNDDVNSAMEICSALSRVFYKGDPRVIENVYLVFAGFQGHEAAVDFGNRPGSIHIIPLFETRSGAVELSKVLVVDGMTFGSSSVTTTCDLVRYADGDFGLLADCKPKTLEYRCLTETLLVRNVIKRPRKAGHLIKRARAALVQRDS